jgi:hypothetical protein
VDEASLPVTPIRDVAHKYLRLHLEYRNRVSAETLTEKNKPPPSGGGRWAWTNSWRFFFRNP